MKVARHYRRFIDHDTDVLAIGRNSNEEFRRVFTSLRLPFPGISDPECAILDAYGQEVTWWKLGRMPAQFLIEQGRGVVRFAEYSQTQSAITPPEEILTLLSKM